MKKILLFAALAVGMLSANAQYTLTKQWSIDLANLGLTTNDVRQGIGLNGKFYINQKTADATKIVVISRGGLEDQVLPGGLNCGITIDEAGNLVVSNAQFPNAWVCDGQTPVIKVINPESGESKEYALPDMEIPRCDFLGKAKGDMMNEGTLYIAPNSAVVVKAVVIDGEISEDETYAAAVEGVNPSGNNLVNYFVDKDNNDSYLYVYRSAAPVLLAEDGDNFAPAQTLVLPNKGNCNGAWPFVFDGKNMVVYPTTPNYLDGFAIAEIGAEEAIVEVPAIATANPNGVQCDWLNAEVVDENTVNIYQYVPGGHVSVYQLAKEVTAVNDVNAAKTVSGVKYVNVAGMESDVPFEGVNIVVTSYSDGSQSATKILK